jgi:Ca-activated chloride channel family protein
MDYARPEFLQYRPWLFAWAAAMALLACQQFWAHRRAVSGAMAARFGPAFSLGRALLKLALLTAAGWFLLLALATPLGEPVKMESESSGADVILAVDVSSSMYAQDVAPNRLLALKSALNGFIGRLGGDRVGIVAFAGEAVVACPLTTDYDTATLFLDKLETDSVPADGTGFAAAIKLCLDAFQADPKRGRMIVFATDGEDTLDSNAASEAKRAGSLGVPIYTLGVGTPEGAYIPGRPDLFGRVLAKTYQGQPIRTKLNPETLKKIASLSGGRYFAGASPAALNAAYDTVRGLKQGAAKVKDRYVRDPLYQKPLFTALLLLIAEMLLSNRAGGTLRALRATGSFLLRLKNRRAVPRAALLALAVMSMAFSLDPGRGEYDQGNALYRQGQYDKAAEQYENSLQQKEQRFEPHYNLGNAKFMQEDYDGAIQAYEDALKLKPDDPDTLYNLELAKKRKEGKKDGKGKDSKGDKKGPGQKQGQGQNGQGGQGQSQGGQKGQGKPQPGGQGKPGSANDLSQDQIHAMMNMLKNDQKRYGQAFQPLKKHPKQDDQPQDPFEAMFEQMTGRKIKPEPQGGNSNRKDW